MQQSSNTSLDINYNIIKAVTNVNSCSSLVASTRLKSSYTTFSVNVITYFANYNTEV